jgi:23S rRNA pseudouridine1911/1915/1917 synthase
MKLNVLYEDNHIIIVEKIINIPTQADKSGDIDMCNLIKQYIKEKYNKPGDVFLGIVHRLDRPVGGIMVFAKTSKAASRLSEEIRMRRFKKQYLAVVHGEIKEDQGTLENYLLKDTKTNIVKVEENDINGAKKAVLDYRVLAYKNQKTLIEINLHTGRPHQIRVQFANIGHPLVGDVKYGNDEKNTNIALWAYKISFKHPTKDEIMEFELLPKNTIIDSFGIQLVKREII